MSNAGGTTVVAGRGRPVASRRRARPFTIVAVDVAAAFLAW